MRKGGRKGRLTRPWRPDRHPPSSPLASHSAGWRPQREAPWTRRPKFLPKQTTSNWILSQERTVERADGRIFSMMSCINPCQAPTGPFHGADLNGISPSPFQLSVNAEELSPVVGNRKGNALGTVLKREGSTTRRVEFFDRGPKLPATRAVRSA